MVSSARVPRSATLNEQWLIMRLITSVGLTLLLMLGLAATAHSESSEAASIPLMVSGLMDPHVAPVADAPAEHEEAASGAWSESNARSEEHTSELQSLMRISYAVFCLKQKKKPKTTYTNK